MPIPVKRHDQPTRTFAHRITAEWKPLCFSVGQFSIVASNDRSAALSRASNNCDPLEVVRRGFVR